MAGQHHQNHLAGMIQTEMAATGAWSIAPSSRVLLGDAAAEARRQQTHSSGLVNTKRKDYRLLDRGEYGELMYMWRRDPVLRSALNVLRFMARRAAVILKPRDEGGSGGGGGNKNRGKRVVSPELEAFARDTLQPMLVDALTHSLMLGYIVFKVDWRRSPRIGPTPILVHPDLVQVAVEIDPGKMRWKLVAMDPQGSTTPARGVYVYATEDPAMDGTFASVGATLLAEYKRLRALKLLEISQERKRMDDIVYLQQMPRGAEGAHDAQVSAFADANLFAQELTYRTARGDVAAGMVRGHIDAEDERAVQHGLNPPYKYPLPAGQTVVTPATSVNRVDLTAQDDHRADFVFATMGVPRSIAMSGSRFSSDVTAAFTTLNTTMKGHREMLSRFLYDVYVRTWGTDDGLVVDIQMDGLLSAENILTAGKNGYIAPEDEATLFLELADIPADMNFMRNNPKTARIVAQKRKEFLELGEGEGLKCALEVEAHDQETKLNDANLRATQKETALMTAATATAGGGGAPRSAPPKGASASASSSSSVVARSSADTGGNARSAVARGGAQGCGTCGASGGGAGDAAAGGRASDDAHGADDPATAKRKKEEKKKKKQGEKDEDAEKKKKKKKEEEKKNKKEDDEADGEEEAKLKKKRKVGQPTAMADRK